MSNSFDREKDRTSAIVEKLGNYFGHCELHSINRTDAAIVHGDHFCLILEVKCEVGMGGCDSYMELVAYYVQNIKEKHIRSSATPCFLIEIVGTHMAVYGAVFLSRSGACVDRLTPCLWITFQPYNRLAMEELAKTFKALKSAVVHLQTYYRELTEDGTCTFPFFKSFVFNSEKYEITYVDYIKDHVLRGVTRNAQNVIVKFVEHQYGKEAHQLLEEKGFAPKLLFCEKVTSRFHMVVMEELKDAYSLGRYISCFPQKNILFLKERCQQALRILHSNNFCHGDFRENNILVIPSSNGISPDIKVIDFDWSGKTHIGTYPSFMNHHDLEWHETASDGKCLQPEHDTYWLDKTFR
jgi:hypothetical protein